MGSGIQNRFIIHIELTKLVHALALVMSNQGELLEKAGADFLIMPCNTAHNFYEPVSRQVSIPFFHMIAQTLRHIQQNYPSGSKVGLLATEGTVASKIYHRLFEQAGFEIITPDHQMQNSVSQFIYDVKGAGDTSGGARLQTPADALFEQGCVTSILGCTELSVGNDEYHFKGNFVDPLNEISKKAIAESNPRHHQAEPQLLV